MLFDAVEWIEDKMNEKGISQRQLSRLMGLSSSAVSAVLTRRNHISAEFCISAARALNQPPQIPLRLAGYLPANTPAADGNSQTQQVVDMMGCMNEEDKAEIVAYTRYWLDRSRERLANKKKPI